MSFNFPNAPADGTIYSPVGGPTYTFSGGVWKVAGSAGSSFVVVSDTAPAAPYPGMLWFESDSGALFFWYVDADSSQWVQINFTPSGMNTAQTRNRIVNPAMQHSQELGNAATPLLAGYDAFIVDQTSVQVSGALGTGRITVQRVQVSTPNGSTNRLRITVTATEAVAGASSWVNVHQRLEGNKVADFRWGSASAKQAVLRFGFKGPAGQYSIAIRNGALDRGYLAPFTIAAGQANTDTEQVLVIPGDVTGTWAVDNTSGFEVCITFTDASNPRGVAGWQASGKLTLAGNFNIFSSTSNVMEVFDVGLYLDPDATGIPPKWQMPDEAQELAACMRYWQPLMMDLIGYASGAAGFVGAHIMYPVVPRVTPALTTASNGTLSNASSAVFDSARVYSCRALLTSAAAGNVGGAGRTGNANARM